MDDTFATDGGRDATKWQERHAKRKAEGAKMSNGIKPVVRTSAGLRDALFDAIDNLRNGEIEPPEAKAVATLAQQICNTVQLEMDVHKLRQTFPSDAKLIVPHPIPLAAVPAIDDKNSK